MAGLQVRRAKSVLCSRQEQDSVAGRALLLRGVDGEIYQRWRRRQEAGLVEADEQDAKRMYVVTIVYSI